MIKFNTKVLYVGPLNYGVPSEDLKWVVRSKEKKREEVEQVFDAVVVATGHHSKPRFPCMQGMDTWRRKQMHSHIYRSPEPFRGELHKIWYTVNIDTLEEDGSAIFMDGSIIIADTILYCTGYNYSFPFLDTKGMVVVDDNRVGPLYEHTLPPLLAPPLSFIGIPKKILGLPFFESQGKWIAQLLSGKKALPSCEEMMKSIEEFYHSKEVVGIPKRFTHEIGAIGFEYCDKSAKYVGLPKLQEWRKELCILSLVNSCVNLETYRDSWNDDEKLQEALQSPYFTQLGVELEDPSLQNSN
ncbi:Flavin-containing monooxygenase FMO GS-OX-like 8 [Glycine soja]|nr:Flavin-containing monooxygenase FMO GS-OX-like 8 [Glycine soja]